MVKVERVVIMKEIRHKLKNIGLFKIIIIFAVVIFISLIIFKPSFARYIYNGLKNYYYESQSFFFNCDKLSTEGAVFQLDNWDGVNSFDVTFNMDSFKNNLISSNSDISYDITYSCSSKADCTISKENGLIPSSTHTDYFVITVTPNMTLIEGDSITLDVSVTSTSPYIKTLTGKVRLNVGIPGITYEISDKVNRPYLDFKITNTLDYYQVVTAFGTYNVGDFIEQNVYNSLSNDDKAKCTSALIKLEFNPNIILVDMTSEFYDNAYSYTTQMINNKEYINSVVFGMNPVSSMNIRFYKVEASNNYTYPYTNPTSIIDFNVL